MSTKVLRQAKEILEKKQTNKKTKQTRIQICCSVSFYFSVYDRILLYSLDHSVTSVIQVRFKR